MAKFNFCPVDGNRLVRFACPECGWKPPRAASKGESDGQCTYRCGDSRCPMPAAWYDQPIGGQGWCRAHDDWKKRLEPGPEAQAQLAHIIQNRAQYMDAYYPRTCWQDEATDARMAENPEWNRGDGEGKTEYARRMSGLGKSLARKLNRRVRGMADGGR